MTGGQKVIIAIVCLLIAIIIFRVFAVMQLVKLAKIQKAEFDKEAELLAAKKLTLKK